MLSCGGVVGAEVGCVVVTLIKTVALVASYDGRSCLIARIRDTPRKFGAIGFITRIPRVSIMHAHTISPSKNNIRRVAIFYFSRGDLFVAATATRLRASNGTISLRNGYGIAMPSRARALRLMNGRGLACFHRSGCHKVSTMSIVTTLRTSTKHVVC